METSSTNSSRIIGRSFNKEGRFSTKSLGNTTTIYIVVEPFDLWCGGGVDEALEFERAVVVLPGHRLLWEVRSLALGHFTTR